MKLIDPLGLEVLALGDYGGVQSMTPVDLGFKERSPDYYALSGSVGILQFVIEVDKFGNIFISPVNPSFGPAPVTMSLSAGWIDKCGDVEEKDTEDFLSGWSYNTSAFYGVGGGYTYVPGQGGALELGVSLPNFGLSIPHSTKDN